MNALPPTDAASQQGEEDIVERFVRECTSYAEARRFMVTALSAVEAELPELAVEAVNKVQEHTQHELSSETEESLRVQLWTSIHGRDQERTDTVLRTRVAICVLYAGAHPAPDPGLTLEFFVDMFRQAKLRDSALYEAARSQ